MTPLPKRRHSSKRSGSRRSADTLQKPEIATCSHCGAHKQAHTICPSCGYYKGKHVLQVKAPKTA